MASRAGVPRSGLTYAVAFGGFVRELAGARGRPNAELLGKGPPPDTSAYERSSNPSCCALAFPFGDALVATAACGRS